MAWGLLAVGLALLAGLTMGLGGLALPRADGLTRLLAGAVLTVALVVVSTEVLATVGVLNTATLLALWAVAAAAVGFSALRRGMRWQLSWRAARDLAGAPLLLVAAAALALAAFAAYYLPVWQWDALGYHLPFVNLVLQDGRLADVPADVPYLSTYPHTTEWVFTAWRALLPDDRLVDLGQLPFGLLGAVAIAVIGRDRGAASTHAVAIGAAWLTLPAVFLQLPTNYTDVAAAALALAAIAFLLSDLDPNRILLAGTAIGLFLAAKPQAPPAAAVLLVVLAVLGWRARARVATAAAWLVALLLGARSYLQLWIRHGNPVWPVRVEVGPVRLPGPKPLAELLAAGANAPRPQGNWVSRVAQSWTTVISPAPVFDMRIGGLGLLFLIALPVAAVCVLRARPVPVLACVAATLATPDPSVARYVLAFAGLVLALAAPALSLLRPRLQVAVLWGLAAVAASNLMLSYPGLTGEGPPLSDYPAMSPAQRQRAVGAEGSPAGYRDAVAQVSPGELTVVDVGTDLPYLAWPSDLSGRVLFVPPDAGDDDVEQLVIDPRVRLLIVGDDTAAGRAVRRHAELFEPVFACRSSPCAGHLRR